VMTLRTATRARDMPETLAGEWDLCRDSGETCHLGRMS